MTRSVGYSQCVLVDTNYPMTANYPQVNLSLVKNEPLDSIDYLSMNSSQISPQTSSQTSLQTNYSYVQQQHQQQISPNALILPPTPPSPSDAQLDVQQLIVQSTGHHCNPQINQIKQTNQSQVLNQPSAHSPINGQINSQINSQISNQVKSQTNLKMSNQMSSQVNRINDSINARSTSQANNQMSSQISSQINSQISSQTNSHPINQIKNAPQYLMPTKPQLMPAQQTSAIGKYRKKHGLAKPYHLPSGDQRIPLKSGNSISRRNERERRRVRNVNNGFQELRKRIPQGEKKLSKVETLRSAVKYIQDLQTMLNGLNQEDGQESSAELLFSILQQNSLNALVNSESSSNSQMAASQSTGSQPDSSMVDYFDLTELLSQ